MKIDVDSFAKELESKIRSIIENADTTDLYLRIGEYLRSVVIEEQFDTLGKYFNDTEWAALSEGYKEQLRKKGRDLRPTLQRTGRLASSFDYNVSNDSIIISNAVEYAKYLHEGTSSMPARPIFWTKELPEEAQQGIQRIFEEWIVERLNAID